MHSADWFILGTLAMITVFDITLIVRGTPTISRRLRAYGYRVSAAPFSWGALGGHFWGPNIDPAFNSYPISIMALLSLAVLVAGAHRLILNAYDPPDWVVLFYIPLGVLPGAVLWPQ